MTPQTEMLRDRVSVPLGHRSYDILIGDGLLASLGEHVADCLPRPFAVIVTDETVAGAHLETAERGLAAQGIVARTIVMPPGEATKSFAALEGLTDRLLEARVERRDAVIALGGGVIGDLVGFAAAILRRGTGFIQVPTTLLAQVDSSVGGKTGINTRHGKNLIGAFHQPRRVIADLGVLDTLPDRHRRAGYAEIVKYGLIDRPGFFDWLEDHGAAVLAGDRAAQAHAVAESCRAKSAIVAADEREQGRRALLNLGHTFAHALEAATGYSDTLYHGEAVAMGLVLAFRLSARLGHCSDEDAARVERHLAAHGLATDPRTVLPAGINAEHLIGLMAQDKKVQAGRLTLVLARGVGEAFITQDVAPDDLNSFLTDMLAGHPRQA